MMVLVRVSERRFLVLEVEQQESAYMAAEGAPGKGYLISSGKLIHPRPVSMQEARSAMSNFARENARLVTSEQWQKELEARRKKT